MKNKYLLKLKGMTKRPGIEQPSTILVFDMIYPDDMIQRTYPCYIVLDEYHSSPDEDYHSSDTVADATLYMGRMPCDYLPTKEYPLIEISEEHTNSRIYSYDGERIVENEIFSYFPYGRYDDTYYPDGYYEIHAEFKPVPRCPQGLITWIFYGDSASGKTTLSTMLGQANFGYHLSSYETDSSPDLPPNLENYDIIVVGNKYRFAIEDIVNSIKDRRKVVLLNFNKNNF